MFEVKKALYEGRVSLRNEIFKKYLLIILISLGS